MGFLSGKKFLDSLATPARAVKVFDGVWLKMFAFGEPDCAIIPQNTSIAPLFGTNTIMRIHISLLALIAFLAITSSAQPARQDIVDDGYTWFEAPTAEVLTGNSIPTSMGWMLKTYVRIFGEYPGGSKIKFVVAKAGKTTGTTLCNTGQYHKTANDLDDSYMWTNDCWQKESATKETGIFEVDVFALNGSTGAERLVRKYTIDVHAASRVPSGQGAGTAPPIYYISRHNEAPVSFMYLRPTNYIPYFDFAQRPERSGNNLVELHFSLSNQVRDMLPDMTFGCTVNGTPLTLPGPADFATGARMQVVRSYQTIYQDRIAPKYKAGMPYEEEISFRMIRLPVPLSWGGDRRANRVLLEDHPGNWVCTISKNNTVWRTWRWTIGKNGRPSTHAEQQGNTNLSFNTYLIDMEISSGGAPMDGRLAGPSTSFFYGQPWTSAEGKAMAGKVPKKGNPYPVTSNLAK